jgi:hypothetical protein
VTSINIIFDGHPGPKGPRFVEIEDDHGKSVRIGDWSEHQPEGYEHEGFWKLRISLAELMQLGAEQKRGQDALADYVPELPEEGDHV